MVRLLDEVVFVNGSKIDKVFYDCMYVTVLNRSWQPAGISVLSWCVLLIPVCSTQRRSLEIYGTVYTVVGH